MIVSAPPCREQAEFVLNGFEKDFIRTKEGMLYCSFRIYWYMSKFVMTEFQSLDHNLDSGSGLLAARTMRSEIRNRMKWSACNRAHIKCRALAIHRVHCASAANSLPDIHYF